MYSKQYAKWVPSVEEPLDPLPTPGAGNIPVALNRADHDLAIIDV